MISTFLIKKRSFNLYSGFWCVELCRLEFGLHRIIRPSKRNTRLSVSLLLGLTFTRTSSEKMKWTVSRCYNYILIPYLLRTHCSTVPSLSSPSSPRFSPIRGFLSVQLAVSLVLAAKGPRSSGRPVMERTCPTPPAVASTALQLVSKSPCLRKRATGPWEVWCSPSRRNNAKWGPWGVLEGNTSMLVAYPDPLLWGCSERRDVTRDH